MPDISPDSRATTDSGAAATGRTARLWISWLLVAALLGYGVVETVITAAKLFG